MTTELLVTNVVQYTYECSELRRLPNLAANTMIMSASASIMHYTENSGLRREPVRPI